MKSDVQVAKNRWVVPGIAAVGVVFVALGLPLMAQSGGGSGSAPTQTQSGSGQDQNPFPGEAPRADAQKTQDKTQDKPQPAATAGGADKPGGDNPFPGEDTNAPIIPVDPGPGSGRRDGSGNRPAGGSSSDDPVRSPDAPGSTSSDDGFSSSNAGLSGLGDPDADKSPRKPVKSRSKAQVVKEDVDVGEFYLEKKNWKAAFERFTEAFTLDDESPDAVFGLAEAEQHLAMNDKAKEHYELFLAYDPDGPHSKAAKKALAEVQSASKAK